MSLGIQLALVGWLQLVALASGEHLQRSIVGPQGIVVPKRSGLIMGLDASFKQRATKTTIGQQQASVSSQEPVVGLKVNANANANASQQQPNGNSNTKTKGSSRFVPSILWLASQRRGHPQVASGQPQRQVFLDRHQQEILAANPNIEELNAVASRSDANQASNQQEKVTETSNNQRAADSNSNSNPKSEGQFYKGYSLIELEVRSDSERRFVQDLYGNLSAAIEEQAQNPNGASVSPYVDVDFWSFKAALDDHIDIMVSPKSRAFILGQLNRAKIRTRIKIDDIQSRLDSQRAPAAASGQTQPQYQSQTPAQPETRADGQSQSQSLGQLSGRVGNHQSQLQPQSQPQPNQSQESAANAESFITAPRSESTVSLNESLFFENYQRLADINQYLESIVEKNPDVARVQVIGRSSQGRYLRVLKLGYDQRDADGSTSQVSPTGQPEPEDQSRATINGSSILRNFFRRQESGRKLGSIWLDGGTHAREWISPATVLYLSHRLADNHQKCGQFFAYLRALVQNYEQQELQRNSRQNRNLRNQPNSRLDADLINGIIDINSSLLGKPTELSRPRKEAEKSLELLAKNPQDLATEHNCDLQIEQILRRYTFYIMPVLNPDGYEYSHTHNRLWRKTRSTSSHPIYRHFCLGADPNRNYDARHGSTGSSTHPCSQTFGGNVPFTEPETRHQSNFVYANRIGMKMYISFHSYSQMILLPFSHSKQIAPDHKDLDSVGQAAVRAIERTHGTVYRVGPSSSILYTASGTASDWAYENAGIKYSYTIELRDTGSYGFLLPAKQILPTGEETFNGLLAMIEQMERNDNLLTSKSSLQVKSANCSGLSDMSHVPLELEEMEALAKQKSQPPLENAIDGSDTWATASSVPSGVRDRGRPLVLRDPPSDESRFAASSGSAEFTLDQLSSSGRLDEEPSGNDIELDSGYAFEGEGELMEPTRGNIIEAARAADMRLSGRLDHARRIVAAAGITSSGRNYINSPLLASRTTPTSLKRESSDSLVTESLSVL